MYRQYTPAQNAKFLMICNYFAGILSYEDLGKLFADKHAHGLMKPVSRQAIRQRYERLTGSELKLRPELIKKIVTEMQSGILFDK